MIFTKPMIFKFPRAFEGENQPGWALDENGAVKMQDGNPVYVQSDGSEGVVKTDTISRLNREAKDHRTEKEKAQERLKAFEGIDDPKKAREAMERLAKLDEKELYESGDVEKLKKEISDQYTGQIGEKDKEISNLQSQVSKLMLDNAFGNSEYVRDNVAVPADMFRAQFGNNFKVENGSLTPYDAQGNVIYSRKNVGEVADFDEAIEQLVSNYKHKDSILKTDGHGGSGGSRGGARNGSRYMSRSQFSELSPAQQADAAKKMRSGELVLRD